MSDFAAAFVRADGRSFDGLLKLDGRPEPPLFDVEWDLAVDRFRTALARFDAPPVADNDCDAQEPVRLDWDAIREAAVPEEESEFERRFGCTTRSANGGGERAGHAQPMRRQFDPVAMARRYRTRPGLRRAVDEGRFGQRTMAARIAADDAAAKEPREVRTMPKGKRIDCEAVMVEMERAGESGSTAAALAKALRCSQAAVDGHLRALRGVKRVRVIAGGRRAGPFVWAATSAKRAPITPREIKRTVERALKPLVGKPVVDDAPQARPSVEIEISQATGDRLVEFARDIEGAIIRGAQRRVAAALRAEAERLEAEAGSAA